MKFARSILTSALSHQFFPAPLNTPRSASAVISPHPYATSGRLVSAPWEGLYLQDGDAEPGTVLFVKP